MYSSPLANVLFQQMLSWHASKDDLVIVLKDDKELVYTTPHAAPVAAAMTKYATALADESAKKLAERSVGDSDLMSDTSEEEEEQQKEGGEPVDIHLGTIAIEERVFDVYKGTRMFQMQVGSKALTILSAGDVVDSMLFGQLTGWEVTGSNLILTMSDQSEKSFRSDHVAEIAQAIAHKQKSLSGARKSGQNEVFQVSAMSSDDFAPPKKAGKLRRMSISLGLASNSPLESASKLTTASAMGATQLIEYNVKQGSSKLKLQVGSMGLTVTKNGKPHESSILFAKASGWNVEGNTLRVEPVDGGSTLVFTVADEEQAEGIAETMTANAMVLAKAKRQMANSQSAAPAKMEQLKTTGGHVDEDEDLHFDSTSEDDFDSGVSQAPTAELSGVSTVKPRRGSVDKLNRNYAKKLKRVAISARPMSAESANVELLDIPKNKEEITFLRNALRGQPLFQDLDKEQIDQFVGCMAHEKFANGDVLITQGDLGDKFFVLRSGSCNCTIGGKSVKLYEVGQSFGELALLYDCPRAASVTATTTVTVWSVGVAAFKRIAIAGAAEKRRRVVEVLEQVPILKSLSAARRATMAEAMTIEHYDTGQLIIKQGDAGELFYVMMQGEAVVKISGVGEIARKRAGGTGREAYFGETALLDNAPRNADIRAVRPCTCLELSRQDFVRLIGNWRELEQEATAMAAEEEDSARGGRGALLLGELDSASKKMMFEGEQLALVDFEVGSLLGRGSFGRVVHVKHKSSGRFFALKCLSKAELLRMGQIPHLMNEKFVLQQIHHPSLVNMEGVFQDRSYVYMVLEYVVGGELYMYTAEAGKLKNPAARFYAGQIVKALSYLHNKNIVYRDLKPENILLDSVGYVKVTDFGFAKQLQPGERTHTVCGTPEYIAPEIIAHKGHSAAADWWSLGILIYELLTGLTPYETEEGGMATYKKIMDGRFQLYSETEQAQGLIRGLLTQDPTKRLGCQASGLQEIVGHKWWQASDFDWTALETRQSEAPWTPPSTLESDVSNFIQDEDGEDESSRLNDKAPSKKEQKLFAAFG